MALCKSIVDQCVSTHVLHKIGVYLFLEYVRWSSLSCEQDMTQIALLLFQFFTSIMVSSHFEMPFKS